MSVSGKGPYDQPYWADMRRSTKLLALYERDGGICQLCGRPVSVNGANGATIDHIIPRSKGGVDYPSNWQLAHIRCNSTKHTSTTAEFRAEMAKKINEAQSKFAEIVEIMAMPNKSSMAYWQRMYRARERELDAILRRYALKE